MTDQPQTGQAPRAPRQGPDPELGFLVHLANSSGFGADVLLTLSGLVVGGQLTSGDAHFSGLAESVEAGNGEKAVLDAVADAFRDVAKDYRETYSRRQADPGPGIAFIHLKHAYIVGPGGGPMSVGPWRGRLSEVTAWSLGKVRS